MSIRFLRALILCSGLALPTLATALEFGAILQQQWPDTDFTRATVDPREILSGGPPKDGIPPIDDPAFESISGASLWIHPDEPVISVSIGGENRAYPLQILTWHEIVNDTIGDIPVSVTFCPLCNASIVFDRRFEERILDFGTTGLLRYSDLIMYDRQTQSWWQQFVGEAIVGELTGGRLQRIESSIVSFRTFANAYPGGSVLGRDTGSQRPYGSNPYPGYDDIDSSPFLFQGPADGRLPPMERVLGVRIGDRSKIYPFSRLDSGTLIEDRIGNIDFIVARTGKLLSALDQREISASAPVAEVVAWQRRTEDDATVLSFRHTGEGLQDIETGSRWNALGVAIDGPLKGAKLAGLDAGVHFAFAWLAFDPETEIWQPQE